VIPEGDILEGMQLDALAMKQQLSIIARTDVLMGMHGAGLSHTLFLPPHAGLLEFYPTYWPQANKHFRTFAFWRKLHYDNWQNMDQANEKDNHRTYIPPSVVVGLVQKIRKAMCS
jgi:glycoprotein 2-beta-D-xylosyltransferase